MSTAAQDETMVGTPLDQLRATLPEQAQRHLDALKGAIELRLSALEAALADPNGGASLEVLILDLARVASVEAQAAATKACVDTQLVSDTQKAKALAAAQQVLHQERATSADLRKALEQAQQKLARTEAELRGEIRLAREALDAESARARSAATEADRALQTARQEVTRARDEGARILAATKDEASQALTAAKNEAARALAVAKSEAAGALAQSRDQAAHALAELEQALTASRQQTEQARQERDKERTSNGELRRALERSEERLSDAGKDLAQARAMHEATGEDLAKARDAVATLQQSLDASRSEYQALLAAHGELTTALEKERNLRAELERRAAESENAVEMERRRFENAQAVKAALQQQLDDATTKLAAMGPEHAEARAAHEKITKELLKERERNNELRTKLSEVEPRLRELERLRTELQRQVDAERMVSTEMRTAADQAERRVASVIGNQVQALSDQQDLVRDLEMARARILSLEAELDAAQGRISRTDGERAGAIERLQEIETRLRSAPTDPPAFEPPAHAIPGAPASEEAPSAVAQDDAPASPWVPVRLAERFRFPEPLTVPINGGAGLLCDLSVLGCQVVSGSALKPNQKVKVVLPTDVPLTCTGKVMWARLEPSPKGRGFGYRAGVQFVKPPQDLLAAFIDARKPR